MKITNQHIRAAQILSEEPMLLAELLMVFKAECETEWARAEKAEALVRSVQAELLAGGSLARLRAIVGINNQEDSNA